MPDFLIGLAAALAGMAALMVFASFADDSLSEDSAGRALARIFAAALSLSALFITALALILLRGDRDRADHYIVPVIVGVLIGALEGYLFLNPGEPLLLLLPLLLFVFCSRSLRRKLGSMADGKGVRGQ